MREAQPWSNSSFRGTVSPGTELSTEGIRIYTGPYRRKNRLEGISDGVVAKSFQNWYRKIKMHRLKLLLKH